MIGFADLFFIRNLIDLELLFGFDNQFSKEYDFQQSYINSP